MSRGRRPSVLAAGFVVFLWALPAAPAAPAPRDPAASERQLRDLRSRIEKLQSTLDAAEQSRGEAAGLLRESDRATSEAHRALFELRQRRTALEADLSGIAEREADTRTALAEQQALAAKLLRLQYQQGAPDRLRLVLEGRDPEQAARHLQYYGYVQRARADLIGELRKKRDELASLESDARARHEELAQNEAEQAEESRRLEKERAARAATVKRLAGEISKNRREIGQLKRDEARLARLVDEIARALAARQKEKEREREEGAARGEPVDRVADASLSAHPFASLKGKLRLPVRGRLVNRYGERREEGAAWKGLFIRAVTGETVHAVADGLVVYADWLRGFGNLLILDHGGGFMSLYAYNEGLLRKVGEKVRAGDPVANVGASGSSADSGLYFELRRDGKPFDPLKWTAR
ncbi:MAG TPA: peptidoglycan DD-metalloendopeptidase family protein [Usitatibacter sp.]|jgi:septal ring factor EnvC (AmiA/AmiB activator)|nr:peptidoglycan DD-metalloendopeptidase family protein [Usitatibacter sp.]